MPPFTVLNHSLPFTVVIGGLRIISDTVNQAGTLGALATDGADVYLISCYHVLCDHTGAPPPPGGIAGKVYQPSTTLVGGAAHTPLADLDPARADHALDCAAAKLAANAVPQPRILGIGKILVPSLQPLAIGTPVLKSGCGTGVTEGVVTAVNGAAITIEAAKEHAGYNCSEGGDSGSLWVNRETRQAVALHRAGSAAAGGTCDAADINAVLAALNLQLLV